MRGLDAYYGDPPEPPEQCDACAFTDTHCRECCCCSLEGHRDWHPALDPDCILCLTQSIAVLEKIVSGLQSRIQEVKAIARVCSFTPDHPDIEVVPVENVLAALDGDA